MTRRVSKLTKKDFELIARVIREEVDHYRDIEGYVPITHERLVALFVDNLQAANPRFDAGRFREACGVERIFNAS